MAQSDSIAPDAPLPDPTEGQAHAHGIHPALDAQGEVFLPPQPYAMQPARLRRIPQNDSAETSYLFGSSGSLDKPAWSDSTGGRAAIRFFSRGIVGAAFFALGGHYATKKMRNYEPEVYGALTLEKILKTSPLQTIARVIDAGPGTIIKGIFKEDAVRFRERMQFHNPSLDHYLTPQQVDFLENVRPHGRSLGSEVVMVTFDFFSASIGDALTRNLIQAFDPHVRQPWIVNDKGHSSIPGSGHFDAGKWLQSVARSSWRIFSKNAMEDWAAALPYVYQMKWQRQAINNIGSKARSRGEIPKLSGAGFKQSADSNVNGAVTNIDQNGNVVNGYQWAGALDLHLRFVGYNWYTLMYREAYDAVARGLDQWRKSGFKIEAPHIDNPVHATGKLLTDTARYVTKSFIKANLYMQPAVIPFWLIRVPQTKWRGQYTMKDELTGKFAPVRTESGGFYPRAKLIHAEEWPPQAYLNGREVLTHTSSDPHFIKNITDPYSMKIKRGLFDTIVNPIGAVSYHMGSALTHAVDRISPTPGRITNWLMEGTGATNLALEREKLLRNFTDAGLSYYPYMWMKAETALRVDDRKSTQVDGKMDTAIYNFMDNVGRFNFSGIVQSAKNIGHLAFHEEKELVSREGHHLQKVVEEQAQVAALSTEQQANQAPKTSISAASIQRQGAQEKPATAANQNISHANDGQENWATSVASAHDERDHAHQQRA